MNELAEKINHEIESRGPISFARFMEIALYCPVYGYYEGEKDTIGKRGDYFTSVSTGSLFGQLVAAQFAEWLSRDTQNYRGGPAQIIEAGAHDGRFALDVLSWLREHRAALFQNLHYRILEPSTRRREWQRQILTEFLEKVDWVSDLSGLSDSSRRGNDSTGVHGVIFSNEFLDAFPVHRFGWDASQQNWFEWGVAVSNGSFSWERMAVEATPPQLSHLSTQLLERLPNGFVLDLSPAAAQWWRTAGEQLARGKLVAIDYGLTIEELLTPEKRAGTLRAYHQHHVGDDMLARPGQQDITATVDWSAIRAAGESAGLKTEALVSQEKFLTQIAAKAWERPETFGRWNAEFTRQFQTLTHPEHLGRRFSVLVQGRE